MSHTLKTGVTRGRLEAGDLGSFEIRNAEISVEDYQTAARLVENYGLVEWGDADPGPPSTSDESEADTEESDESEAATEESDESEAATEGFDPSTLTVPEVRDDVQSVESIEALEDARDVELDNDDRKGVHDALDERLDEIQGE